MPVGAMRLRWTCGLAQAPGAVQTARHAAVEKPAGP